MKKYCWILFQTGLDVIGAFDTEKEALLAKNLTDLVPLNIEKWDREEAEEAYPNIFKTSARSLVAAGREEA